MQKHPVGYLIGSLAKNSINRKLALALVKLAPSHLEMKEISFNELPLYSYDYDIRSFRRSRAPSRRPSRLLMLFCS